MPRGVHHHVHAWNQEESVVKVKRPCADSRGLTKPSQFCPQRILVSMHVRHASQINKQGIALLDASIMPLTGKREEASGAR